MAVADFFRAPQIGDIDARSYSGQPGNNITIPATDDFQAAGVKVKIEAGDHSVSEEGEAVLQGDGVSWLYTATQTLGSLPGCTILD